MRSIVKVEAARRGYERWAPCIETGLSLDLYLIKESQTCLINVDRHDFVVRCDINRAASRTNSEMIMSNPALDFLE